MLLYVVFGGMLATTWVQIIKAVLLMFGITVMSLFVLAEVGWNPIDLFNEAEQNTTEESTFSLGPGTYLSSPIDTISLGLALVLGTAGLPHILMRFFTVPDAKAARTSVMWAVGLIGAFYVMTTFLGFGARAFLGEAGVAAGRLRVGEQEAKLAALRRVGLVYRPEYRFAYITWRYGLGIQAWIGGWALYQILAVYFPSWSGLPPTFVGINAPQLVCFLATGAVVRLVAPLLGDNAPLGPEFLDRLPGRRRPPGDPLVARPHRRRGDSDGRRRDLRHVQPAHRPRRAARRRQHRSRALGARGGRRRLLTAEIVRRKPEDRKTFIAITAV